MLSQVYKNKRDRWLEGCLSIPKLWGFVDRPYEVTVEYFSPVLTSDIWQLKAVSATFTDTESAYVQHEIDHLDGILFTDRILSQNGQIYRETTDGLTPIKI